MRLEAQDDGPVIQVARGCEAQRQGIGCGCTGACLETIDVVPASAYWRVVGERDEARRQNQETTK